LDRRVIDVQLQRNESVVVVVFLGKEQIKECNLANTHILDSADNLLFHRFCGVQVGDGDSGEEDIVSRHRSL
jgi:hypothetical protein